jgi:hypothetical protein
MMEGNIFFNIFYIILNFGENERFANKLKGTSVWGLIALTFTLKK